MIPQISVIVPVYNTKKYLRRCIDSLLIQTLPEIEIILVNDGSTDGSGEICDAYAKANANIRVIHKENQGLSAARNDGIEIAQAEYIMFVDSDDWVTHRFCEAPLRAAVEQCADLVFIGYYNVRDDRVEGRGIPAESRVITEEDALHMIMDGPVGAMAWNKLYHKDLFRSLRFPIGRWYEDVGTTYQAVHLARRIYCLSEHLYYYTSNREGSITSRHDLKKTIDKFDMYFLRLRNLTDWGYDVKREEATTALAYLIRIGRKGNRSAECDRIIRSSDCALSACNWKQKIILQLYKGFPSLFDSVCAIMGRRIG